MATNNFKTIDTVVFRYEFTIIDNYERKTILDYESSDVLKEMMKLKKFVLLGDPGAGKSSTFIKLLEQVLIDYNSDSSIIPIFLSIGEWINRSGDFKEFIYSKFESLDLIFGKLCDEGRILILVDGLNELPFENRSQKIKGITKFLDEFPRVSFAVSCRTEDYDDEFSYPKVIINPLSVEKVMEFLVKYLGREKGEYLFWRIAGSIELKNVYEVWRLKGYNLLDFWKLETTPKEVYEITSKQQDDLRNYARLNESSLMNLAVNPYMLLMLLNIYLRFDELPENRASTFRMFIDTLLVRENLFDEQGGGIKVNSRGRDLIDSLKGLAYSMQAQRRFNRKSFSAVTTVSYEEAIGVLNEENLKLAKDCSILYGSAEIRFAHQLLQEYFLALFLEGEISKNNLKASDIWSNEDWWEKNNWEESFDLLGNIYHDKISILLEWLSDKNPTISSRLMSKHKDFVSKPLKSRIASKWLSAMLSPKSKIRSRVDLGKALGLIDLDNRYGIGLDESGFPLFEWIELPSDNDKSKKFMSKYLVTIKQFRSFVKDGGYSHSTWWADLPEADPVPPEPSFDFPNMPMHNVSWFSAVAFTKWLSIKLEEEIRLPTETEWELFAKNGFNNSTDIYPCGKEMPDNGCNYFETNIGQPSVVGIFPESDTKLGITDLCGNVWEWTITRKNISDESISKDLFNRRPTIIKGGSYIDLKSQLKIRSRRFNIQHATNPFQGFRVIKIQK